MIERKLNSGRSILEMLGVLAIVAVITLNGLGLIRFLINYAEAYSTIKSANETAVELRIRQGRGYLVENYWMFNANITKWDGEHGEQRVLTLAMRNTTPEDLCKAILRQAERNTEIIHVEPANCTADNNQVVFYFAFDEGTYHSPFTGDANTDKSDPLSGGCAGKSIPNGACIYEDENCILRKDVGDSCGSGSVCLPEGTDLVCRACPEELPDGRCTAWDGCDDLVDKADGDSCGGNFQCQSGECVCLLECDGGQQKNEADCRCVCPASKPKWDGSKCVTCFEYDSQYPYWNGSRCDACPFRTPYWNGTECVEDPCSLEDSTWTAIEPDISRTNYLANAAFACEVGDDIGAFTLEQLQVGTTGDGTACYCDSGYYTYFEGGCASDAKSCRDCPGSYESFNDNVYSAIFSCQTGKWWYDEYTSNIVSCDDSYSINYHESNSLSSCQYKWDFCDLSGTPMMMGRYCFSCDRPYVENAMSTADTDLVNATCGWSGEDACVYAGYGEIGYTYSCAQVKADIGYGVFYADSDVCKTVRYNDDEWCFGWDCAQCTSTYGSDEYCQYVGNTCGLNLEWSEDRGGCVMNCPDNTPYWNGSECVTCFEYDSQYPYWNGTECVEDPCSLVNSSWTVTEPDISRKNYLGSGPSVCEVDYEGAFTLEQLQVGTTEDETACYCGGGYYTYFEGGCASGTKSCRECPSGFSSGYGVVEGNEVEYITDNGYSALFSCGTGKWYYDWYTGEKFVSCDGPIREHEGSSPFECQNKWDFCDLSGEPMMMGFYCFSCDDLDDYVENAVSTTDTDLVNATCGLSGEDAYVYAGSGGAGGAGYTYSCAQVSEEIENNGYFPADSICKTVRYNDDDWCFGLNCIDCTSPYESGDEYCNYVGDTCGLDLEWSEDKGGCV